MRMQLKKIGMLLSLAGLFVLLAASEPYGEWFSTSVPMKTYCSEHGTFHMLEYSEERNAYRGYCVCDPGWIGVRCHIPLADD